MIRVFFLSVILLQSVASFSQTYWKLTDENGEQLLLTIIVNERKNEFEAYTRSNALKDIAGSFNYFLALTAGKIQYPEIIYIRGNTSKHADSLILSGTFYYVDKKFPFRASIHGNNISGKFIDYRNRTNHITGVRVPDRRPVNDYRRVISYANSVTAKYIFNPELLRSEEWSDFINKIDELKSNISDDYEIRVTYYWLGRDLPFTPYELNRVNLNKKPPVTGRKMTIGEPKPKTAYLDAGMFPLSAREMDTLSGLIAKRGFTNLIIDLRGKSGMQPESAEYLLCYLSHVPFTGGIYPTRKYMDTNKTVPKSQDYQKYFRSFTEVPYKPGEFRNETGRYFKITPSSKTFRGKVYVLSDSRTSGVSSSFIYLVKKYRIATIAGQTASASSGISERIPLTNEFSLTLAVSEFLTPENRSLTATDLLPDIILSDENALEYLLNILR